MMKSLKLLSSITIIILVILLSPCLRSQDSTILLVTPAAVTNIFNSMFSGGITFTNPIFKGAFNTGNYLTAQYDSSSFYFSYAPVGDIFRIDNGGNIYLPNGAGYINSLQANQASLTNTTLYSGVNTILSGTSLLTPWYSTNLTATGVFTGTLYGDGANILNLNAAQLLAGTVPTARLGSGTANSSTYLRGDSTWAAISATGDVTGGSTSTDNEVVIYNGTGGKTIKSSGIPVTTLVSNGYASSLSFATNTVAWNNPQTIIGTNSASPSNSIAFNTPNGLAANIHTNGGVFIQKSLTVGANQTNAGQLVIAAGSKAAPALAKQGAGTTGLYFASTGMGLSIAGGSYIYANDSSSGLTLRNNWPLSWGSGDAEGTPDTRIARETAAIIELGLDASPAVGYTFKGGDGSGTDIAGGSLIVAAGRSTGTGLPGVLHLAVATNTASTGSTQNSLTNVISIASGTFGLVVTNKATKTIFDNGLVQLNLTTFLASDATTTSATLANLSGLTVTNVLASGNYTFKCILYVSDSVAADGAKIDFGGGTATATDFRAHVTTFDSALNLSTQLTSLTGAATMSTLTGSSMIEIHGSIIVNAGGTFIPRFAQSAHTTGTLTVFKGSHILFTQMP
jgi:hypothetical protein